jgi:hypothetical protein
MKNHREQQNNQKTGLITPMIKRKNSGVQKP